MVVPHKGDYVWIESKDNQSVAIGARIKDIVRDQITVVDDEDNTYVLKPGSRVRHMHVSSIGGVTDMISLGDLNEAGILRNLFVRYKRQEIYTYTGTILVAVNPYEELPIYTPNHIRMYTGSDRVSSGTLPPHIFAVAARSYYGITHDDINSSQAMVISGESGAGKTESTKLALQQLAAASGRHSWIEQQVLDCNPILEAFGNAATLRNHNSSRFGKFVDVQFESGRISGASIEQFLLERSRIVKQARGERNYHVFYCLFQANNEALDRDNLGLTDAHDFFYLNQGGDIISAEKSPDVVTFATLRSAMKVLKFSDQECSQIFQLLAALLHLGNVAFASGGPNNGEDSCHAIADEALDLACNMFGVSRDDLQKSLTTRTIITRDDLVVSPVAPDTALAIRDALVKGVYARLFVWVVQRINKAIQPPDSSKTKRNDIRSIGILDIFGFENFDHNQNSLEQLCINYANESLQQFFVRHVFRLEQEEYEAEGVDWQRVEFKDNLDTLELLAGESNVKINVLSLIDEESGFPKGTDRSMLDKFNRAWSSTKEQHPIFIRHKSDVAQVFGIRHFAGPVFYSVDGFLEKNRDTFNADLIDLVRTSKNVFLKTLFENDLKMGFETRKKSPTVVIQFRRSLERLMRILNEREPHFVRCIKPNDNKSSRNFDRDLVLRQLRYSGMMETIRVRKAGYPIRHEFHHFVDRYKIFRILIFDKEEQQRKQQITKNKKGNRSLLPKLPNNTKEASMLICSKLLESNGYQIGKTKVFLKEAMDIKLEDLRERTLQKNVIIIQKNWRKYIQRKRFMIMKKAAIQIQTRYRGYTAAYKYRKIKRGISLLQAAYRARLASKKLKDLRGFMIKFQRFCRGKLARGKLERKKKSIVILQTGLRGMLARRRVVAMKREKIQIEQEMQLKKEEEMRLRKEMDSVRATQEAEKRHQERLAEMKSKDEQDANSQIEKGRLMKEKLEQAEKRQQLPVDDSTMVDEIFGEFDESTNKNKENNQTGNDWFNFSTADNDCIVGDNRNNYGDFPNEPEHNYWRFAAAHYQPGQEPDLTRKPLQRPLLYQNNMGNIGDKEAALAVWLVILRFTRDLPDHPTALAAAKQKQQQQRKQDGGVSGSKGSVMSHIYRSLGRKFDPMQLQLIADGYDQQLATPYESARAPTGKKNLVSLTLKKKSKLTEDVLAQLRRAGDNLSNLGGSGNKDEQLLGDTIPHPVTSLEKLHFIIGQGIYRPQLRDEIYCQMLKQLAGNKRPESVTRGIVLMALCAGCFVPSSERLVSVVRQFAREQLPDSAARFIATRLARTRQNGTRTQPPSWVELRAARARRAFVPLAVTTMDGMQIAVGVDAAATALEIVCAIASKLRLHDQFGFSIFIAVLEKVSSLGAGHEHVLDAVSQCEQFARESAGLPESRARWRLFLRKELFSPWHSTSDCNVATKLIFRQVLRCLSHGEYRCETEKDLIYICALHALVDKPETKNGLVTLETIEEYVPPYAIGTTKESRNRWVNLISKEMTQLHQSGTVPNEQVAMQHIVEYAKDAWPMLFSRFYEAVKFSGPTLQTNDLIITVNSTGVYLVDGNENFHLELPFPEIVAVSSSRILDLTQKNTSRLHGQTLSLSTMKGDTYTFNSPNSEDIRDLIVMFLEGLKERSVYLVALQKFNKPDPSFLECERGDLIILDEQFASTGRHLNSDWWYGTNARTNQSGDFPSELVYVLPTLTMPSPGVLALFGNGFGSNGTRPSLSAQSSVKDTSDDGRTVKQRTLEEYAKSHFRSSGSSECLWKHSIQALRLPLLKRLQTRDELHQPSISCHSAILRYQGDQPSRDLSSSELTELIFEPCLRNEQLKDEIYCQLVRQITHNPSNQSEKAGWELIWLATGIMCPSSALYRELMEIFRTAKSPLATDCLNRLQKTAKSGQRRFPPHPIEINAVQMGRIIHHKIFFPNDTSEPFEISSNTKCKDLCTNICRRLRINENIRGYSLFVRSSDKAISVPEGDFFFDFLRQLSDWILRHRPARDGKLEFSYQVFFMRKLWAGVVPGDDPIADTILHYPQEVRKYLHGYHKITISDAIVLGALVLRSELKSVDNNELQDALQHPENYMPADILNKNSISDIKEKVMQQYIAISAAKKSVQEANQNFLKEIYKLPTFGSAFFEVKQSTNPSIPEKIFIAINKNGVYLIHFKTKEILEHYPYSSISNWSSGNTYFNMTIGNLIHGKKLLCETPLGYKMDDLLTSYISLMLNTLNSNNIDASKTLNNQSRSNIPNTMSPHKITSGTVTAKISLR